MSITTKRCETCRVGTAPHWAHVEVWRNDEVWVPSCADGTVIWHRQVIEPLVDDASHRANSLAPRAWIRPLT